MVKAIMREFLRKNKMSNVSPMWCKVNGLTRNECKDICGNLSQKHGDTVIKRDGLCGGKGVKSKCRFY